MLRSHLCVICVWTFSAKHRAADWFTLSSKAVTTRVSRWVWGYCFGEALRYGSIPRQVGLYVGSEPLRMKSEVQADGWIYRFDLVDVRGLDGEALLESDNLGDNVMAVLTRLGGRGDTVRRVLKQIAASPPGEQALAEFCIVAGL